MAGTPPTSGNGGWIVGASLGMFRLRRARARARRAPAAGSVSALILLALTVALLAGCGGSGGSAAIGEKASNDKVAVTVNSVKTYTQITTEDGDVLTMKSPKDVYVVVDMTIRNLQDTAHQIDPENIRLVTADGKYWSGDGGQFVADFPDEFKALTARTLGPGKQARGMVGHGVPIGTELKSVTYVADPDIEISLDGMKVAAPAVKKPPKVGQTAKGGGLAFTVHSMTSPSSLTHGMWTTTPKSGDKLVLLNVTVKNLDRTPSYKVDPLAVAIVDAKGTRWGSFNRSAMGLAGSEQLPIKKLRPGAKVSGKVVISVPKNAKLKTIRFESGVMGPPLEVRVAK